ncbi:hypothetical protein BKA83DRAFT_4258269 [Pisolithus microcarpus]|nr:hypothetical protein BKA83DRAFT_4258269 [Pisolithus microcarpus]
MLWFCTRLSLFVTCGHALLFFDVLVNALIGRRYYWSRPGTSTSPGTLLSEVSGSFQMDQTMRRSIKVKRSLYDVSNTNGERLALVWGVKMTE